ncbi:anti-anti-sigma regulatory factor [Streptomyces achromogenes]|uniref:STAS domain-containing protein n=1 Tax=Streptomyces achromogenes TaxID=67255 RepID=UPI00277EE28E|nr:STAS domain-containing protein [Streptomyces achromogenes]MDQ0833018.1 anti-anti-sigma regulatory factor [Streptomyces achromogenes]
MSWGLDHGLPIVEATTPPVLTLTGPATSGQAAGLGDAVRMLLTAAETGVVVCDVAGIGPPGLLTVDLLARLQLAARRAGGRIRLRGPDPALRALLHLVGLPVEVEGEVEEGEPALGVEVEVEPGEAAL